MWTRVITFAVTLTIVLGDDGPTIEREVSDGVQSMGYKLIYGDEDMTVINQVVTDAEKSSMIKKNRVNLNEAIKPLAPEDVKCLMSVDRYCSKKMGAMKSVLIQAIKEDCAKCSIKQKDEAGKVIASMMAHDPVAWKLFLTRYDGLDKVQRILG
uniref:Chemosensory protein n=1 Tax=Heliothis virescens TaxID=7102 RepID=A0A2A4J1R5_HELVI